MKYYEVVKTETYVSNWDKFASWSEKTGMTSCRTEKEAMKYISGLNLTRNFEGTDLKVYGNKIVDKMTDNGRYIKYEDKKDDDTFEIRIFIIKKEKRDRNVSSKREID